MTSYYTLDKIQISYYVLKVQADLDQIHPFASASTTCHLLPESRPHGFLTVPKHAMLIPPQGLCTSCSLGSASRPLQV